MSINCEWIRKVQNLRGSVRGSLNYPLGNLILIDVSVAVSVKEEVYLTSAIKSIFFLTEVQCSMSIKERSNTSA